jgi:azurin
MRMNRLKLIFCTAILCGMIITGCGNASDKNGEKQGREVVNPTTFTINAIGNTMADMGYDTREIKVSAGADISINLVNKGTDGAMLHNIVIVKQGAEKEVAMEGISLKEQNYFNPQNPNVIAGSAIANPGATVILRFTAPQKGTYTYLCTYPGHWMKMQGTLTVE